MDKKEEKKSDAEEQAEAQVSSIVEMVEALQKAEEEGDDTKREEAETAIHEDPLSVEVRSGWTSPGAKMEAEEFCILLCTGGPAVRIVGDLSEHGEPTRARVQHQDWGTPWIEIFPSSDDREKILTYCQQFYFGE